MASIIRNEFGRRIKVTSRKLTKGQVEEVLRRSGTFQLYRNLSKRDHKNLTLNLILDDSIFPAPILDEADVLLDGHQRMMAFVAMENSKATGKLPVKVVRGLTEEEKLWLVRSLNDNRRHLTPHDRQVSIARCLDRFAKEGRNPSDRLVASILALDHKTVGACRKKMAAGKIDLEPRVGSDGKSRRVHLAKSTAWQQLKEEYGGFEKPGRLFLLVDDLSNVRDTHEQAGALAKLADHLLSQAGAALVLLAPQQVGDTVVAFSKKFYCRWVWPVLLPQQLAKKTVPQIMALFIRRGRLPWVDVIREAYDMRRHSSKGAQEIRFLATERILADGLADQFPHIHARLLDPDDQVRLAKSCGKTFYDKHGRSI